MFTMQSLSYNPVLATFQLSAASLNLGQSQNEVLGIGLKKNVFSVISKDEL